MIPGELYVAPSAVHDPGPVPRLLGELALGDVQRILAALVDQPRRQLHEPASGRVAVLAQAQHPLVVVEGEDHDSARVLEHQPPERLLVRLPWSLDQVGPQRHHPASRCRSVEAMTGQSSGTSARSAMAANATVTRVEDGLSLRQEEAADRAELIEVDRYDITVDLRRLLQGEVWTAASRIRFRCRQPGATTFVDCVAEVHGATLNGVDLEPATFADGRIPLPDLASENELVVSSSQPDTGRGAAIKHTVDPSDKLVYVWSSFEPDGARRAWACFDQPDLKAPHRFEVAAPDEWTVTSNCAPDSVDDFEDGGRVWRFPDTPPLSTYVVVVNAGPFHEIREQRGDHSLGLYCRQSLRRFLERDAAELLRVTEQGLAFFGERFALPFPQERPCAAGCRLTRRHGGGRRHGEKIFSEDSEETERPF